MWFALTSNDQPCCDLDFDGRWWIVLEEQAVLDKIKSLLPSCVRVIPLSGLKMQEELLSRCLLDEVDGLVVWTETDGTYSKVLMQPPLLQLSWDAPALA